MAVECYLYFYSLLFYYLKDMPPANSKSGRIPNWIKRESVAGLQPNFDRMAMCWPPYVFNDYWTERPQ